MVELSALPASRATGYGNMIFIIIIYNFSGRKHERQVSSIQGCLVHLIQYSKKSFQYNFVNKGVQNTFLFLFFQSFTPSTVT